MDQLEIHDRIKKTKKAIRQTDFWLSFCVTAMITYFVTLFVICFI